MRCIRESRFLETRHRRGGITNQEKTKLEFRAESFNVLNLVVWNNPGNLSAFNNPNNFAKITGTRGPARTGQLALKFYF